MPIKTDTKTAEMLAVFSSHGDRKQRAFIQKLARTPAKSLSLLKPLLAPEALPSIQRWAIEALGHFPESKTLPLIKRALKSPHMSVRLHAIVALAQFNNPKHALLLRPLLTDPSGGIRMNALTLLARYSPHWLSRELKQALDDQKPYIRRFAQKQLAHRQRKNATIG